LNIEFYNIKLILSIIDIKFVLKDIDLWNNHITEKRLCSMIHIILKQWILIEIYLLLY
jgi:hypothetical protein